MTSLGESVLAHGADRPAAPALRWRGGSVSYAELAARVTGCLDDLSSRAGEGPVAVVSKKSSETIALVLACTIARRAVLLPAPDLGQEGLSRLVARSGCGWVARATAAGTEWQDAGQDGSCAQPAGGKRFLLTTSGSTGTPKIVPLEAAATESFMGWATTAFGLGPGVNVLNYAPLNFDLCLLDVWATLKAGGCAILVDPDHAVNPRYLLDLFGTCDPHVVQAVPMLFRVIAQAANGARFPGVRHLMLTGDHAPRRLRAPLPGLFPGAGFHNVYGCTETNDSFMHSFGAEEARSAEVLPLGQPLPGVTARVVTDSGDLDGPGHGELWVSTPFQTPGYLHEAGERFVRHHDGTTYFRSGDVVRRGPDGALTLAGRTDFQVKVRGVRVNLEDVERVIYEHDDVAEVAVVALPDHEAGNRLHAAVRRRSDRLTGLGLRQHCAQRLARAAIPSNIRIVDDPLPTTSTGKVDRNRIREWAQAGES
jgi:acyl-CoA synthetase (AMP-forming)/AMP-acid ligase II